MFSPVSVTTAAVPAMLTVSDRLLSGTVKVIAPVPSIGPPCSRLHVPSAIATTGRSADMLPALIAGTKACTS